MLLLYIWSTTGVRVTARRRRRRVQISPSVRDCERSRVRDIEDSLLRRLPSGFVQHRRVRSFCVAQKSLISSLPKHFTLFRVCFKTLIVASRIEHDIKLLFFIFIKNVHVSIIIHTSIALIYLGEIRDLLIKELLFISYFISYYLYFLPE